MSPAQLDAAAAVTDLRKKGLAPKSVKNYTSTLHSVFDYALRKRWIGENPCRLVSKPQTEDADADIRFSSSTNSKPSFARSPTATPAEWSNEFSTGSPR